MRTMRWPPQVRNGRFDFVDGPQAASVLIVQTVSDLRQNPYNPDGLSIGDITFKAGSTGRATVEAALKRLQPAVGIEAIVERRAQGAEAEGEVEYQVFFTDHETRTRGEVVVG